MCLLSGLRLSSDHGAARVFDCDLLRHLGMKSLQSRLNRLTLQRQDAKDSLVYAPQRFFANEPFERLDTECEFAES